MATIDMICLSFGERKTSCILSTMNKQMRSPQARRVNDVFVNVIKELENVEMF